jgi:hypothetical protein
MDEREVAERAEDLVAKAEAGDKSALTEELNQMTIEDRLAVVRQMDQINAQHRQDNPNLPDLQFGTTADAAGREHLSDVQMVTQNDSKAWYKPWTWFQASEYKTDVYDPPKEGTVGNGMLGQAVDGILSRNRQLAEIERELGK